MPEHEITHIFDRFLELYRSVDIAESEFKKSMHENPELHTMYRDWCHQVGSSEKHGFTDYCEEYIDNQNSVWDSLSDYDE